MIVIYFSEPAPTPGENGWESCTVTRLTTFSEIHSTQAEDSQRFESWRNIFGKLKKYFWKVGEIFLGVKEIFLKRWRNIFGNLKKYAKIMKVDLKYDGWIAS